MRLTKATHDQLEILLYLNDRPQVYTQVSSISDDLRLTRAIALKLVTALSRLGLLDTKRGQGGGIRLAAPASTLQLGDTISLLETDNAGSVWESRRRSSRKTNRSSDFVDQALSHFIDVLNGYTLHDLGAGRVRYYFAPERRKQSVAGAKS